MSALIKYYFHISIYIDLLTYSWLLAITSRYRWNIKHHSEFDHHKADVLSLLNEIACNVQRISIHYDVTTETISVAMTSYLIWGCSVDVMTSGYIRDVSRASAVNFVIFNNPSIGRSIVRRHTSDRSWDGGEWHGIEWKGSCVVGSVPPVSLPLVRMAYLMQLPLSTDVANSSITV